MAPICIPHFPLHTVTTSLPNTFHPHHVPPSRCPQGASKPLHLFSNSSLQPGTTSIILRIPLPPCHLPFTRQPSLLASVPPYRGILWRLVTHSACTPLQHRPATLAMCWCSADIFVAVFHLLLNLTRHPMITISAELKPTPPKSPRGSPAGQ